MFSHFYVFLVVSRAYGETIKPHQCDVTAAPAQMHRSTNYNNAASEI